MNQQQPGCVGLLSCLLTMGLVAAILGGWFWYHGGNEAKQAHQRLDPERNPDAADRVNAVKDILKLALEGRGLSGWQQLEKKACRDPEAKVRAAAVRALGEFAEAKPEQVLDKRLVAEFQYVDAEFIDSLGQSDPAVEVRVAVADFWAHADVLWKSGFASLETMLANEKDPLVTRAVREALRQRIARSLERGDLNQDRAAELRRRHDLGE